MKKELTILGHKKLFKNNTKKQFLSMKPNNTLNSSILDLKSSNTQKHLSVSGTLINMKLTLRTQRSPYGYCQEKKNFYCQSTTSTKRKLAGLFLLIEYKKDREFKINYLT